MENSKVRRFNNPMFLDQDITSEQVQTFSTYINYLHRLTILAQTRFTWNNLPKELTTRHIERGLFEHGRVVYFKQEPLEMDNGANPTDNDYHKHVDTNGNPNSIYDNRFFALPYTYSSLDMYGDPVNLEAYGLNGYRYRVINNVNGVIIRNNCIATSTADTVIMFAARLTAALRTQDLNIYNNRKSVLYLCDESQKMTLKQLMKQVDQFQPWVLGVKNALDIENVVKVINEQVPYIADRLTDYKNDLWSEILEFFGISRYQNKRERLLNSEINSNNHFAIASINTMLESRREAMYAINDMYGTDIDVHVNDMEDMVYKMMEMSMEGETEFGGAATPSKTEQGGESNWV